MSIYAIVGRNSANELAASLKELGQAEAPVITPDPELAPQALQEAARLPVETLILDVSLGRAADLSPALIRFRVLRPQTRVILLAFGRQPGDPDVAQLVATGVYDIVTDPADLAASLRSPPADFTRAAVWLEPGLAAPEQKPLQREIVVKKVPLSTRPVLIGVLNAAPAAGATTVAALVAAFLARPGYRTCLVAADGTRDLELLSGLDKTRQEPKRWVPDLDLFGGDWRDAAVSGKYQYVVADLGHCDYLEAARLGADLLLVVLPLPHRIDRVLEWKREKSYLALPRARYVSLAAPGSKAVAKAGELAELWVHAFFPAESDRDASLEFVVLPLPPDGPGAVLKAHPELDAALAEVLAPVLPEVSPRRRRFLRLGRKAPQDTIPWAFWPLMAALILMAVAAGWPEIRAAGQELARFGAAVKGVIRDPIGVLFSLLF